MAWKTLLLDNSYQPINIIGWVRAVELLLAGKAEIVEEYDDIPIRSMKLEIKLPSILKLIKNHGRRKRKQVNFSRFNVFLRDQWTCQYCGDKFKTEDLTYDHVIPRSRKTEDSGTCWTNIVTACRDCNHKKGGRTPEEARMKLLKKPIQPEWTPKMTLRLKGNEPKSWLDYIYWHAEIQA